MVLWWDDAPLDPVAYRALLELGIGETESSHDQGPAPAASALATQATSSGVPGDLNSDGETTVTDFGLLWQHLDSSASDVAAYDLNQDGLVDLLDLETVRDNFGVTAPTIDPARQILVTSLGDLDNDSTPDLAVLQDGVKPLLYLTEVGAVGATRTVDLNAAYTYFDIEPIVVGGAVTALAIAGTHEGNDGVRVWLFDLASGALSRGLYFGRTVAMVDMDAWQDAEGHVHAAMVGQVVGRDHARIVVGNFADEQVTIKHVANGYAPTGLEVGLDRGVETIVVAGQTSVGGVRLFGYDAESLLRTISFSFGKMNGVDLAMIENTTGGSALFGLLSTSQPGHYTVDLRSDAGVLTHHVVAQSDREARELALWSDGDGAPHFSVLEIGAADRLAVVTSGAAAAGAGVFSAAAGSGAITDSLAVFHTDDGVAFALGQRNPVTGAEQVRMRLAEANYRLPTFAVPGAPLDDSWYEGERVQGNTRYFVWDPDRGTEFYDLPGSATAGANFAELGAHVFTRSVRHYDEPPWWSSEYPVDANGNQILAEPRSGYGHDLGPLENLVQPMVDEAWASGIPMIAYFNDMSDAMLAEMHPEWIVRNFNGAPESHPNKGVFLDITGPYGDVVLQRLLELADMGVAGIALDYIHLPLDGAYGSQLEQDWIALTGTPAPPKGFTQEYTDFITFCARRMTDTIAGWEAALHAEYPGVELIVSTTTVPGLTRLDMNTDLVAIGDPKSEFFTVTSRLVLDQVFERNPDLYHPEDAIRQAFGFALLRDSAENGTPHFWKSRSPTAEQDLAYISAITTFGGIAALDVLEYLLEPGGSVSGMPSREEYAANFAFGSRISPFLNDLAPESNVAVYWSETARNAWYVVGDAAAWENVNLPALGAYETLMDMGLTATILTDSDVTAGIGSGIDVVFVPDMDNLNADELAELALFIDGGGTILTGDGHDWGTEAGYQAGMADFAAAMLPFRDGAAVRVDGLADQAMAQAYRSETADNRLVVSITNSFDHVQAARLANPIPADEVLPPPDPIAAGASIVIDHDALPAGAGMPYAYDAVSGSMLEVTDGPEGWTVVLPEFAQMLLVVIEMPAA